MREHENDFQLEKQIEKQVESDLLSKASANLLELPQQENWLKKHALEPFIRSAVLEPASVITQFAGSHAKDNSSAEQRKKQLSSTNLAEGFTEMAASMAGAALVYGTMAALTKRAGLALAGSGLVDRSITNALTSNVGSMIAGAALYDFARKPHEGETRLGNAASGAVAFAVFAGGHQLVADKGLAIRLASFPLIGAAGGLAQKQTNVGISQQRWLNGAEMEQAAVQGAILNSLMPLASKGISGLLEVQAQKNLLAESSGAHIDDLMRKARPITAENRRLVMEELGRGRTVPLVAKSPDSGSPSNLSPEHGHLYKVAPIELATTEGRYQQLTPQIQQARNRLANTLNERLEAYNGRILQDAFTDLKHFSERTQLPERMRVRTILEINAMMRRPEVATNLSQTDRAFLGSDILKNITMPGACINQIGGTCVVASYEVRLASLYPQKYANLIRQVATTGSYRSLDGTVTKIPVNSISNADTRGEGNHANRLFQLTVPNIAWQTATKRPDGASVPAGSLVYEMPGNRTYLMDYSSDKRGVPTLNYHNQIIDHPYLTRSSQALIDDRIVGRSEIFQITRSTGHDARGTFSYKSFDDLKGFLGEIAEGKRKDARFPLLIDVDADRIQRGLRKTFTGDPEMNHTATLLSYDGKSGKIELNNTWSSGSGDYVSNKAINLEKLWKALPRARVDEPG